MGAGTDDQFDVIVAHISQNARRYEKGEIKYIQYLDAIDRIFSGGYGWSKKEFYDELNKRLGIETNDSRRAEKAKRETLAVAKKIPSKKKKKE